MRVELDWDKARSTRNHTYLGVRDHEMLFRHGQSQIIPIGRMWTKRGMVVVDGVVFHRLNVDWSRGRTGGRCFM